MRTMTTAALLASAVFCAGDLRAQLSENTGPLLNLHVAHSTLAGTGEDDDEGISGGSLGITAGYGFTERFALVLMLDAAEMDAEGDGEEVPEHDVRVTSGTLAARFGFGDPGLSLRPYLEAGITRVVKVEQDQTVDDITGLEFRHAGTGITIGAGMQWYLSRRLSVDGAMHVTAGSFSELEIEDDEVEFLGEAPGFSATRIQIGATWHP